MQVVFQSEILILVKISFCCSQNFDYNTEFSIMISSTEMILKAKTKPVWYLGPKGSEDAEYLNILSRMF